MCGQAVTPAAGRPGSAAGASAAVPSRVSPAVLAGAAALVVIVAVLIIPRFRGPDPVVPTNAPPFAGVGGQGTGGGDPGSVDLSQMTPRQAADRLFERVMRAVEASDSVQARQFAPMAIQAYGMAEPLDLDGRYHVALLHLVNADAGAARVQAQAILAEVPDHLLGLYTAAQTETVMGNREVADGLYRRFLQSYDAELATQRPEYQEHARILPVMREDAQRIVGGS
jgi:hypothetical protein